MTKMKTLLKIFFVIIAVVGVGFYVVTNHSVKEELYLSCNGDWFKNPEKLDDRALTWGTREEPEKVFFRFQLWRWWVPLWSQSDGAAYLQTESDNSYFIKWVYFADGWNDIAFSTENISGRFSGLSRQITYQNGNREFRGVCDETVENVRNK